MRGDRGARRQLRVYVGHNALDVNAASGGKLNAKRRYDTPDLGNEDGVMPKELSPGKPTTRRYSPEEKAAAVRMVRTLRAELGTEHGTVSGSRSSSGTASSRCGPGCARPTSTTGMRPG